MTDWFYDRNGQATLFIYQEDRFISKYGENLGWLFDSKIYTLHGMHIGWCEEGIIYDRSNRAFAFLRDADGRLPSRPGIGGTPGRPGIPGRPGRPGRSGSIGRPGRGGWSEMSLNEFFNLSE